MVTHVRALLIIRIEEDRGACLLPPSLPAKVHLRVKQQSLTMTLEISLYSLLRLLKRRIPLCLLLCFSWLWIVQPHILSVL